MGDKLHGPYMPATPAAPPGPLAGDDTRLYLIEDDPLIVQFVRETLALRPSWRLLGVSGNLAHACAHALSLPAHVFLIDLGLPDGRGETLVALLARHRPEAERLVFTVFGEEARLVGALEAGATGYVLKGCSSQDLVAAIEQIRSGGAPISPLLARRLLQRFRTPTVRVPESVDDVVLALGGALEVVEAVDLSPREQEVLQLLAQGYVNKEIAQRLSISPATVGSHIKNLYRKLAVHSRVQVVRSAQDRGLL
jgi:DNA-binding NarL/FixJ family response regulator